jgi:PncC family amidohydrolase
MWAATPDEKCGDAVEPTGQAEQTQLSSISPEARILQLLGSGGVLTVSTAESCTGGNVSARLTSMSGSSAYVLGGITAYANSAKEALLGVPREILETVGAVSEECAAAMAEGSLRAYGSDIAVSTTGIAGPGGATARKPVGLVYIAVSGRGETVVEEHHFSGDRAAVTNAATDRALALLLERIEQALGRTDT